MHGFPACKKCIKVSKASWAEYLILRGSFKSIKKHRKKELEKLEQMKSAEFKIIYVSMN